MLRGADDGGTPARGGSDGSGGRTGCRSRLLRGWESRRDRIGACRGVFRVCRRSGVGRGGWGRGVAVTRPSKVPVFWGAAAERTLGSRVRAGVNRASGPAASARLAIRREDEQRDQPGNRGRYSGAQTPPHPLVALRTPHRSAQGAVAGVTAGVVVKDHLPRLADRALGGSGSPATPRLPCPLSLTPSSLAAREHPSLPWTVTVGCGR